MNIMNEIYIYLRQKIKKEMKRRDLKYLKKPPRVAIRFLYYPNNINRKLTSFQSTSSLVDAIVKYVDYEYKILERSSVLLTIRKTEDCRGFISHIVPWIQ